MYVRCSIVFGHLLLVSRGQLALVGTFNHRYPGPLRGAPGGTVPGIFEGSEILRMSRVKKFVKSL